MRKYLFSAFTLAFALAGLSVVAASAGPSFDIEVHPGTTDPLHHRQVFSGWLRGIGCAPSSTSGCPTGDDDRQNTGLLLNKNGPSADPATAGAVVRFHRPVVLTQLGFDYRNGSTCDQSPRFLLVGVSGTHYRVACSYSANSYAGGTSFTRMRNMSPGNGCPPGQVNAINDSTTPSTNVCITEAVKSIQIVFDAGQDDPGCGSPSSSCVNAGSFTGQAILDNIDVNGNLEGD